MPTSDRGGLRAAFTNFNKTDSDREAELKLLGRTIEETRPEPAREKVADSYQVAAGALPVAGGLTPRPLVQREPVRQLSLRCPLSIAAELRRKAAFNQLEQQEIII